MLNFLDTLKTKRWLSSIICTLFVCPLVDIFLISFFSFIGCTTFGYTWYCKLTDECHYINVSATFVKCQNMFLIRYGCDLYGHGVLKLQQAYDTNTVRIRLRKSTGKTRTISRSIQSALTCLKPICSVFQRTCNVYCTVDATQVYA